MKTRIEMVLSSAPLPPFGLWNHGIPASKLKARQILRRRTPFATCNEKT